MDKAMTYFEPHDAGPDSEPIEAGKRIARLLDALESEVNSNIGSGELILHVAMLNKTSNGGWLMVALPWMVLRE